MIAVVRHFHNDIEACVQPDDGVCWGQSEVVQRLRQGWVLSPMSFNIFLVAVLTVVLQRFSVEMVLHAELVHLNEPPTSVKPEPAMDYVCHVVWGMLYADDACIVLRSSQGLTWMMEGVVEVCGDFALTVSAKKTCTMRMPLPRKPQMMVRVEAAKQIYQQGQYFAYLGGTVTRTLDMSFKIARRTRACWMRIRWYLRERSAERGALAQGPIIGKNRGN